MLPQGITNFEPLALEEFVRDVNDGIPEPSPGPWHFTVVRTNSFIRGGSFWAAGDAGDRMYAPGRHRSSANDRYGSVAVSRNRLLSTHSGYL